MQSGLSQLIACSETVNLTYSIAASTPHSNRYGPENILVDSPDPTSRWSSAYHGATHQYILLRLDSLSILQWIKFGKTTKAHPCNVKEFKIFIGASEDHMIEVLHSGLRNDHIPETFPVRHVNNDGFYFPTRFVKIVPLSAHQSNYHTSIWHVALQGIKSSEAVERVRRVHDEYREAIVFRHILKHLRQRRMLTPFETVLSRSFMKLEHPLVSQLHSNLILHGNWSQAEQLLDKCSSAGLFDSFLQSCPPFSTFKQLIGTDADGDVPSPRSGHAMCIDPVNDYIYLHGGFDGEKCLDDFWMYDVKKDKWNVLSLGTAQEQNAPGPRSCHKMVFDPKTGSIYLLGRLTDQDQLRPRTSSPPTPTDHAASPPPPPAASPSQPMRQSRAILHSGPLVIPPMPMPITTSRSSDNYCSEFFRYHARGADAGKWDFLSFDTASTGGPPLVFDHQMVLDSESQMLYVFGGRIVDGDWNTHRYAGMYCYNVRKSKWSCLMQQNGTVAQGIPPRFGHSMLLDPNTKTLYIFAGQREGVLLSDMYAFDLRTYAAKEIFSDSATMEGPEPSFAQRAVIDPELKEIYVISGLISSKSSGAPGEKSKLISLREEMAYWVYRYGTHPGQWTKVLSEPPPGWKDQDTSDIDNIAQENHMPPSDMQALPRPRHACQVVYNPLTKAIYIHGGNAGKIEIAKEPRSNERNQDSEDGEAAEGSNASDSEKENQPEPEPTPDEERLNDFWRFELHRPGSDRVIRRAKFLIRSQQYREMCEEQAAIKALSFLQNDVASVVNHMDPKESDEFRSLMTHLLVPSATLGLSSRTSSTSTVRASQSDSEAPDAEVHKEADDHLRPPEQSRLRSLRSRTFDLFRVDEGQDGDEEEDGEDDNDESNDEEELGNWTNDMSQFHRQGEKEKDVSEGSVTDDLGRTLSVNPDTLLDVPDPVEFRSRGKTEGSVSKSEIPSGIRYQQRTEVFEMLVEFIGEEDKQPSGSLLDLVGEGRGAGTLTSTGIASVDHRPRFIR